MKDGLWIGAALGMLAGAYLAKNNECVSKMVDEGKNKIKHELNKMKCTCGKDSENSLDKK